MSKKGLQPASAEQKADRQFVLAAVAETGGDLRYAAGPLKSDREVVMAAVKQSGGALWHAAAKLKADPEVVLEAVKEDAGALWYASAKLKTNREFVLQCVAVNGNSLRYVATALKDDREVVLTAVAQDRTALRYASASLQKDREIAQASLPPVSTPEPSVIIVQGSIGAKEPAPSPDEALEAARLSRQRRAAGAAKPKDKISKQPDSSDATATPSASPPVQLVLHRRDGSAGSDVSTDEDFETVRQIADTSTGPLPQHVRTGSRDSEFDGATVVFAIPPSKSTGSLQALDRERSHADFKTTGLIGLALARMQSSRELPNEEQAQDAGGGSTLTRHRSAPLPPLLAATATPKTPERAAANVSFFPDTADKLGSSAAGVGQSRLQTPARMHMESLISSAATDVNVPGELTLGSSTGPCKCKRRDGRLLMGLTRCLLLLMCCCGLPLFALIAMRTGAVSDCDEIKDSECWKQFVEAGLGINHQSCKSETSCDELIGEYKTAKGDGEPVERSDGTTLESGWSFVDEGFDLEDITCIEGSSVLRPEPAAELEQLFSECTGVALPVAACTSSIDHCAAVGMTSCGGITSGCVPNGAAVPDCSVVYAAAGDRHARSCPAGCTYTPVIQISPSRCSAGPVTQSKAASICRQSFGARLCTGYELWRSGTGCFSPVGADAEDHLPVWSRTAAAEAFTTMGLMESCPTVDDGSEESLFVAYRGQYAEEPSRKLLCLDGTQDLGLVRCCADTETEQCESDRTELAYNDGSWEEAGSWNVTAYEADYSESVDWQKTVISGSLTLSYCLCLTWVCFLSRKYCYKHYKKIEDLKREAEESHEKEQMRMYGISQGLTGDIEDQQLNQALRRRSLSGLATLRLKGLTRSPRPSESATKRRFNGKQWGDPSAGAPHGCSLSDLPDRAKILVLSHTADCADLARLSVVCKWWRELHRKAARHVNIRWSQWEESDATLDAIGHVLPSYPELVSVDIVADAPTDGCRTQPDPANPEQPILVVGTCAASAALWEYASIRSLSLRAAPLMMEWWAHKGLRGRAAHGGPKATGTVWHLDRNFARVIARSKTLTSLDLRRSTFDQITGWPSSLQLLCLQQCTHMEVLPGDSHTLRSLVSLDVSLCPMLYDVSVLLGASSLQWLDLSGCSRLSELSPIAGCSDLRALNLNRCFNLREVSAVGTLIKLEILDMSSCPLVDSISNLCACETAQRGGSWCKALTRLDLSYTAVSDVACLAPVEGLDGSLFRGCPNLCTLTARGCKAVTEYNVCELLDSLPSLNVDFDLSVSTHGGSVLVDAKVPKHVTDRIHDSVRSSSSSRVSAEVITGDGDDADAGAQVLPAEGSALCSEELSSSLDWRP